MRDSLRNPFYHSEPNKGTSSELTRRLLSSADAQALTEALGEENQSPKIEPQQDLPPTSDISMSTEEQREVGKESLWIKEDYIKWAEDFGKDTGWVDKTFEFQEDGTTIVEGDLILEGEGIKQLPIGLMEVKGSLNISRNPSINLNGYPKKVGGSFLCRSNNILSPQGMPEEIVGDISFRSSHLTSLIGLPKIINNNLNLSWNKFVTLDDFPREIHGDVRLSDNENLVSLDVLSGVKIGGDLWLCDIPATTIPEGIQIEGDIYIREYQTTLSIDVKRKGYRVIIL